MILRRVVSGGQSGADQAGWRAAKLFEIPTGGWMPKGFLTEDGKRPEFAEMYGAKEARTSGYPERTRLNARSADVTLWFGDRESRGGKLTLGACHGPWLVINPAIPQYDWREDRIAAWISDPHLGCKVLNIAGNRESTSPGIGERTEAFLSEVFRILSQQG